jgi:hypothetical protein
MFFGGAIGVGGFTGAACCASAVVPTIAPLSAARDSREKSRRSRLLVLMLLSSFLFRFSCRFVPAYLFAQRALPGCPISYFLSRAAGRFRNPSAAKCLNQEC